MARPKGTFKKVPAYRGPHATGQAVVTLSGKDHYLGKYDTPASWEKYYRLLAEWSGTGGQVSPTTSPTEVTVEEVMASFWVFAVSRYKRKQTLDRYRNALRPVRDLYGSTRAAEFGSKAYKAVRERIMSRRNRNGQPLTYRTINVNMWYVGEVFRWACEEELIPASVNHAIQAVKPLMRGSTAAARDPDDVPPAPQEDIDAVLPLLPKRIQDILNLMLLSGARPGEIVILRACDIEMTMKTDSGVTIDRPVWIFTPHVHKTTYRGYVRHVPFGPRAQEIIRPYLTTNLSEYLFKPFNPGNQSGRELTAEDTRDFSNRRKRRNSRDNFDDTQQKPKRKLKVNPHLTRNGLGYWVMRACRRADKLAHKERPDVPANVQIVKPWHPHQLRHNAATLLRNRYGMDTARAVLGHRDDETTKGYAANDDVIATRVMAEVG